MGEVVDIARFRQARPAWLPMAASDRAEVAELAARLGQPRPGRPAVDGPDLVLRRCGALVGYATGRLESRSGIPVAVVDALAVRPDMRDRGHGGEAVARLLAWAGSRGARAMAAVARDGSDGFWSRQGFRPAPDALRGAAGGTVMARPVPFPGPALLTHASQV